MNFIPTHKTKDGVFDVRLDRITEELQKPKPYWVSKSTTYSAVTVYNNTTYRLSTKTLYLHKTKGLYFKGSSCYRNGVSRYFINELEEIK